MKDPYVKHYSKLIGKKVTKIAIEADGEFNEAYYGLIFNDGTIAWILQDPEGNGPGFLNIDTSEAKKE